MMEFITENGGMIVFIVMVVMMLNFILTGIKKALELIKDKTSSSADNVIYNILDKIVYVLDKIIEFLSANSTKK